MPWEHALPEVVTLSLSPSATVLVTWISFEATDLERAAETWKYCREAPGIVELAAAVLGVLGARDEFGSNDAELQSDRMAVLDINPLERCAKTGIMIM
jgi:hypothetical protein